MVFSAAESACPGESLGKCWWLGNGMTWPTGWRLATAAVGSMFETLPPPPCPSEIAYARGCVVRAPVELGFAPQLLMYRGTAGDK